MTRNIFIVAIAILLNATSCSLSTQNVSKDYDVNELSAINLQFVGGIIFAQSAGCACYLEDPPEFIEKARVTVKSGTLVTFYKDKNAKNIKNLIFYIAAPDLSKMEIDGIGNFDVKEELESEDIASELNGVDNYNVKSLHCDEPKLDIDGVSSTKSNVDCSTIKAKVGGVRNITVSDKADTAFPKRDGAGEINSKNLGCKDVAKKGWNF